MWYFIENGSFWRKYKICPSLKQKLHTEFYKMILPTDLFFDIIISSDSHFFEHPVCKQADTSVVIFRKKGIFYGLLHFYIHNIRAVEK